MNEKVMRMFMPNNTVFTHHKTNSDNQLEAEN